MKAWPIDPLVFRNVKLEVSEKLTPPRGGHMDILHILVVAFKSGAERRALVEPCRVSETRNPATQSNCGKFLRARSYQVGVDKTAHGQGNDLGYGKNARDWIIRSEAPHCSYRAMENVQRLSGCGVLVGVTDGHHKI